MFQKPAVKFNISVFRKDWIKITSIKIGFEIHLRMNAKLQNKFRVDRIILRHWLQFNYYCPVLLNIFYTHFNKTQKSSILKRLFLS